MLSIIHAMFLYFVVVLSFLCFSRSVHALHPLNDGVMTKEDLQEYFGSISSEDGSSFDVVDVSDTGEEVNKRSVDNVPQYDVKFRAFGEDYHARLYENRFLMRPGLRVEFWGKEGMISSKPLQHGCYFFGELLSHNNSVVAISKCSGLRGIFSHGDTDLTILPLSRNHTDLYRTMFRRDATNLHVIHKRTASSGTIDPYSQFCSTEETKDLVDPNTGLTKNEEIQAAMQDQSTQFNIDSKFMELLIVADNEMRSHHKNDLDSYVMTILNIASRRFIDPTLGQNIRLHIVRYIVLESDDVGTATDKFPQQGSFTVSANGAQLLNDFCTWQAVINPMDDTETDHWDNAILLSRYNLFDPNAGNDDLLGRAFFGGTCSRSSQCSVNEDDGLGTGLVIAHETGHTLNLNHDASYGCPDQVNIMSGTRSAGAGSFEWSECSEINIRTFLGSTMSSCLNDEPLIEPVPVNVLPGTTIDYNTQCILAHGNGYTSVLNRPVDCGVLECMDSRGRITYGGVPVMEGTQCAERKWCISGACVENEGLPDPVDGAWSAWDSEPGPCSRSCGRGVQERRRYCNNPMPMFGGRGCPGDPVEYTVCNFQPCNRSQDDFRDEQCAATNDEPFNGQLYNWVAYTTQQIGDALCDHKCLAVGYFWASRAPFQFIDGTQCWDDEDTDSNIIKLCVAGTCRRFGCDGSMRSNLVYDSCGVCGGDGSSCETIQDSFTGGNSTGFVTFLTLPIGSTFVRLTNTNIQYTYMSVTLNGNRVLSGDGSTVPANGRYSAGNMIIRYERDSSQEMITLLGPTTNVIEIEAFLLLDPAVSYIGNVNVRPMIRYEYFAPISQTPMARWEVSQYSDCDATCGGGSQTRVVTCVRDVGGTAQSVDIIECSYMPMPMTSQSCNNLACPDAFQTAWRTTEWFSCSSTCGDGTQTRIAMCVRTDSGDPVADSNCDANTKPPVERACNDGPCPSQVPIVCDGLSTNETGMIIRLGPTPKGKTCRHMIVAPPGKDIIVRFNLINVDCAPSGEAFTLRLGIYGTAYRYCGYYPNPGEIRVRDNIFWIEIKSTQEGHGYDATYTFTDSSEIPPECYEVYTDSTGVLQSINYPNKYQANLRCQTIVVVPPGNRIRLSFRDFTIEDGTPNGECPNDTLEVIDYIPDEEQSEGIRYCGSLARFKWRSRSNVVVLNFVTNSHREHKGYFIKYKTI